MKDWLNLLYWQQALHVARNGAGFSEDESFSIQDWYADIHGWPWAW